jgi:hypothetical protein
MDRFDIQRERDMEAERVAEEAREKLEEDKELARERNKRLVLLGDGHYFDPKDRVILEKEGSQYKRIGHDRRRLRGRPELLREQARLNGYKAVKGGMFWDKKGRKLYILQQGRYVLYSLDRRKRRGPSLRRRAGEKRARA